MTLSNFAMGQFFPAPTMFLAPRVTICCAQPVSLLRLLGDLLAPVHLGLLRLK